MVYTLLQRFYKIAMPSLAFTTCLVQVVEQFFFTSLTLCCIYIIKSCVFSKASYNFFYKKHHDDSKKYFLYLIKKILYVAHPTLTQTVFTGTELFVQLCSRRKHFNACLNFILFCMTFWYSISHVVTGSISVPDKSSESRIWIAAKFITSL